jgi:hypothetical protein
VGFKSNSIFSTTALPLSGTIKPAWLNIYGSLCIGYSKAEQLVETEKMVRIGRLLTVRRACIRRNKIRDINVRLGDIVHRVRE